MNFQTLDIETRERVATVWMNRPDAHNAFDETLIRELSDAFESVEKNPAVRVLVLAGRGESFSAGADLNWMKRAAHAGAEDNRRDARLLSKMIGTLHRLPKPTVARVHGAALGGGAGLTAACDIAVATSNASFATSEVRFGIIPAVISPYLIAAMGRRAAQRYFLTGERFDAHEAYRLGLVHAVCEAGALDVAIAEIVAALLAGGPKAQAAAKDLIARVADRPIDDVLREDTAQRIAVVRATPEAKEGIAAFLDKRKPRWND